MNRHAEFAVWQSPFNWGTVMQHQEDNVIEAETAPSEERIISRQLARELSVEEIEAVSGGTCSCSGCRGDDCDSPVHMM
jgi:hypothetical protein